ncbi:MAG: EscU/YscU/HrcU family type III secretion system export apparatus switch protein [Treponema sp.]|jgi:flagellar biosynthesis protein|nr:EscU/YscU/HrcU family type III secretion system export apparatus switch protein [Treponema sp.]
MKRCNIVIMEKRKTASALSYTPGEIAPRLVASGKGREAERIVSLAREAGIEVVEDSALAALLDARINAGDFIPVWCWEAAAKILAFVLAKEKT